MKKFISGLAALAIAATGIWLYFTPHLTVRAMQTAADNRDAPALSRHINFPAVRESLKGSLNAKMMSTLKGNEGNPFATLGAALAGKLIEGLVDAMITPEGMAALIKGEKPKPAAPAGKAAQGDSPARNDTSAPPGTARDSDTTMAYESWDSFAVTTRKRSSKDEPVVLVLTREGLITWKLTALRLPL